MWWPGCVKCGGQAVFECGGGGQAVFECGGGGQAVLSVVARLC